MKFINFSIVKFAFFLTAGILVAHNFQTDYYFYLFITLFISLFIVWLIIRNHLFQTIYFGIITYSCILFLGALSYQISLPEYQKHHYLQNDLSSLNEPILQLKVIDILKSDTYNSKYIAELIAIDKKSFSGKLLLNIKKDSAETLLRIDDMVLISSRIQKIPIPLNPDQFDYSSYMKSLGVYGQIHINQQNILKQTKGTSTLKGQADKVRNYLIRNLKESSLSPNELAIIQALILGQKRDINKQLYEDYSAAGAIHILAVSGLHVGIIFLILIAILKPLKNLLRSELPISIIIVICLWGFAFLTGLSPSVIRAVTMFSFFAFAKSINRETNAINTLFLSYFVLLIINPLWLFYVGFQLSYLAVFFILWLIPLFNKVYYPKNRILKKFWGIITVTLAAQIGIIPLSIYYFHQFPGLFFITNLIILPFLGILLGGGIILIFLSLINILPDWYALLYNSLIKMMNSSIHWIANQELFLFQDITFSVPKVLTSYLLIISIILFLKKQNRKRRLFFIASLTLLFSVSIIDKYSYSKNELIVFHKSRESIIVNKIGSELQLYKSDSTVTYKNKYPINNYKIANGIKEYSEKAIPHVFKYKEKTILILDSLGVYPKEGKINIAILSNSPKINLDRMLDSLQPNMIIADGNNYKSYLKRWSFSCKEKGINFYFTGADGAFILE
jgi:competence protein ComEC